MPTQAPAPAPVEESEGAAPLPVPAPVPTPVPKPDPPIFTALAKAFTVKDVWREWKEGSAGRPAIRELEEKWGSRWRPGNTIRVQFCRRKVIWDELLGRIARGKSEAEAVAELELLRAGRRLNQLAATTGAGSGGSSGDEGYRALTGPGGPGARGRGYGRIRRWARYGRRGGLPGRLSTAWS